MDRIREEKIRQFAALGVEEAQIFREIMRARHLDYVLFHQPDSRSNREYGLSQEDLQKAAQTLTAEKFGGVPDDAEQYARIYTLALSVDPMMFAGADAATDAVAALAGKAVAHAEAAGQTVLFAGAEQYLPCLTDIFVTLRGKRIAVAVADEAWKEPVAMIYARGRAMTMDEIPGDTERYDYIFYAGRADGDSAAYWQALGAHLAEGGTMEALLPDALLRSDKEAVQAVFREAAARCTVSSLYHVTDGEEEKDFVACGAPDRAGRIVFGELTADGGVRTWDRAALGREAFAAADSWDYDLYAWNGSEALQTILAAGLLDPDFAVGSIFREVPALKGTLGTYAVIHGDAVTDSCVRTDLVKEEPAADVKRVSAGDLAVTLRQGRLCCAVVPAELEGAAAAGDVTVLRPMEDYTAEYLKAYLDGPIGGLFLDGMTAGGACRICPSRLLRLPVRRASPEQIGAVTAVVKRSTAALAAAEADWRKAKRDSVGLMMGR